MEESQVEREILLKEQITWMIQQQYPKDAGWSISVHIWRDINKATVCVLQAPFPLFSEESYDDSWGHWKWTGRGLSSNKKFGPRGEKFAQDISSFGKSLGLKIFIRAGTRTLPFRVWGTFSEKLDLL